MITFKKLQKVKEMNKQLVVYKFLLILKKTLIALDLSKQKALDANPKAIQQYQFYRKSKSRPLLRKKWKKPFFYFLQGTVKVLWIYFTLIYY